MSYHDWCTDRLALPILTTPGSSFGSFLYSKPDGKPYLLPLPSHPNIQSENQMIIQTGNTERLLNATFQA